MSRVPDEQKKCQQIFLRLMLKNMGQMEINSKHRLFIRFIVTFMQKNSKKNLNLLMYLSFL